MRSKVDGIDQVKGLMIYTLLLFSLLSLTIPAFSKESQKLLYQRDSLTITETKATYRGKVIYDAVEEPKKSGDDGAFMVYRYIPLSLVGPYFSYKCDFYDNGSGGCQYTSNFITIATVNLKTIQPISVLDLVDEASLVAALKNDGWVKDNVENLQQLSSCRNLKEIIAIIGVGGREQVFFEPLAANSFYFFEFNQRTGLIALRLTRNEPLGCSSQNIIFELGLWVKPKKGMEKLFLGESDFNLSRVYPTSK